jgi:hypothetical protein
LSLLHHHCYSTSSPPLQTPAVPLRGPALSELCSGDLILLYELCTASSLFAHMIIKKTADYEEISITCRLMEHSLPSTKAPSWRHCQCQRTGRVTAATADEVAAPSP